jgi:hypothetical protein
VGAATSPTTSASTGSPARALMSPRTFARRFKATTGRRRTPGCSPSGWPRPRRCWRAVTPRSRRVARLVGFGTAAGLPRAVRPPPRGLPAGLPADVPPRARRGGRRPGGLLEDPRPPRGRTPSCHPSHAQGGARDGASGGDPAAGPTGPGP